MNKPDRKENISLRTALFVLLAILGLLFGGSIYYKLPSQIVLLACSILTAGVAYSKGYHMNEIQEMAVKGIQSVAVAFICNICIGMLISSWISAGTFSFLIRLVIKIITPRFFLTETFLFCCLFSALIGSSWICAGTIGLSAFYIAQSTGVNQLLLLGAIVGGSRFGTCISPISDSANISTLLSGVSNIYYHIRSSCVAVFPAVALTSGVYLFIDFFFGEERDTLSASALISVMNGVFRDSIWMVLPPVVLCVMIYRKSNTLICLLGSVAAGIAVAVIVQKKSIVQMADILFNGYGKYISAENAMLKQILSRGGIVSMSNVMFTLIIGMSLGGLLNGLSIFGTLADAIIRRIDRFRAKDLVLISSLLSLMGYAITGDSQPTKMLVSNAFRDVYAQKKIDCGVLSRTLDIAGFGEGIFPWTVGGTYFATLFNVSVGRYWYLVFFYYFAIAFNVHTVGRLKSKRYSL